MNSTYDYSSSMSPDQAAAFIAMFGGFLLIILAICAVFYILSSIGLYKMAKNDGIENAWLAWIPIGNYYIMGRLTKGNFTIFKNKIQSPELVLPIGLVGCSLLSAIPFIGFIAAIASIILSISSIYHLIRKYKGESATGLTILSILVPVVYPFLLFSMRNTIPVDPSYGGNGGYFGGGCGGGYDGGYNNCGYNGQ